MLHSTVFGGVDAIKAAESSCRYIIGCTIELIRGVSTMEKYNSGSGEQEQGNLNSAGWPMPSPTRHDTDGDYYVEGVGYVGGGFGERGSAVADGDAEVEGLSDGAL